MDWRFLDIGVPIYSTSPPPIRGDGAGGELSAVGQASPVARLGCSGIGNQFGNKSAADPNAQLVLIELELEG